MYSLGLLLPDIRDYFKATQDEANLIISLNSGLLFLCGPTVAGFSNKFTIRAVIMVGSICTSLTFVLATYSPNIYTMIASFGFFGG
jgi:predicted MFS family arabinose efflux permease